MGAGLARTALVAAGALLLGLVVGRFSNRSQASPPAPALTSVSRHEPVANEQLVDRLRAVENAVRELNAKPTRAEPAAGTAHPAREERHQEPEPTAAELAESSVLQRALSESEFEGQVGASPWGREKERLRRDVQPRTARLAGFSCRASLCRLDVQHLNGTTATDFVDELEFSPLFANAELTVFPSELGPDRSVMFLRPNARSVQ
jgi:hypothetical protein